MTLQTGNKIGNYEIISTLGEGGMGAVYKAKHVELGKTVALKVLKPELSQNKNFFQRFQIEAKAAAKLNHPNIVTVHDIGQEGDINYFILDYVLGEDLEEVITSQGNLTYEKAKEIIKQIALALDYAHNNGIIHRDIKTRNIMIDEHGNAKLTDFGIARVTEETRMTSTGTFMGTVEYMSPEQAMGKTVDGRSDIYSLGIVFYELVTGDVPFKGDTTPIATAMKHVNEKVISPRDLNGLIPEIGERIILRCLEKDPDIRFQTGRELAEAIEQEKLKEIRTQTGSLIKKNCPFCGEEIMASALKCRYCGTFLDKPQAKTTDTSKMLLQGLIAIAILITGIIAVVIIMPFINKFSPQPQQIVIPTIQPTIAPIQTPSATQIIPTSISTPKLVSDYTEELTTVIQRVQDYLYAWERMDITTMEFILHNSFVGGDGRSKFNFIAQRKKEAEITKSRKITWMNMLADISDNNATVTYTQEYNDYFNNGQSYSSKTNVRMQLVKWQDGQWYLIKETYY